MRHIVTTAVAFLLAFPAAYLHQPTVAAQEKKAQPKKVQPKKAPKFPAGTAEHRDLRYGPHEERNVLDLFVPKSEQPLPLIIWIHGGAWAAGSKDGGNPAIRFLADGYAVAAINYRLSQHAIYPAQIEDCKAAVRFLRGNAKKYNLNPDAFGVWGASAGGHLVALLGTSGDVKELEGTVGDHDEVSSRVQCVVDFFGPTDLTKMSAQALPTSKFDHDGPNSPESKLVGGPIQKNKDKAAKANPIAFVTKDDAPILLLHGDEDPLVPLGQSELLLEAMKKAKVEAEMVVIKGGGHGGPGFASEENQEKIAKFFAKHLKK